MGSECREVGGIRGGISVMLNYGLGEKGACVPTILPSLFLFSTTIKK